MRKDVHPYEYMDDKEKFNETSLLEKEGFYRHLNVDLTDADYKHAEIVCKEFQIKSRWFRRISWFVCWKSYIIVSWYYCYWEL